MRPAEWLKLVGKRLLLTDCVTQTSRDEWTLLEISSNGKVGKFRNELADSLFWTDLRDLELLEELPPASDLPLRVQRMSALTNHPNTNEQAGRSFAPATGSRADVVAELLRRCEAREIRLCQAALDAKCEDDTEGVWIAMAARAENNRFKARLIADMKETVSR